MGEEYEIQLSRYPLDRYILVHLIEMAIFNSSPPHYNYCIIIIIIKLS